MPWLREVAGRGRNHQGALRPQNVFFLFSFTLSFNPYLTNRVQLASAAADTRSLWQEAERVKITAPCYRTKAKAHTENNAHTYRGKWSHLEQTMKCKLDKDIHTNTQIYTSQNTPIHRHANNAKTGSNSNIKDLNTYWLAKCLKRNISESLIWWSGHKTLEVACRRIFHSKTLRVKLCSFNGGKSRIRDILHKLLWSKRSTLKDKFKNWTYKSI